MHRILATTLALILCVASAAGAQALGPFSWQTQPYCNVVTVWLLPQGGQYHVTGTDTMCGGGTAPVTGTAVPDAAGVILGLTVVRPDGRASHLSATVSLATVSGPWSDGEGHSGIFAFNGASVGAPRPAPSSAAAIEVNQLAPTIYAGTGGAATLARSDHTHDDRYFTEAETTALVATRARPVEVFNFASALTLVPDAQQYDFQFTTTVPGRLDMRMPFRGNVTSCSSSSAHPVLYFVLDGVPVRSSVTTIMPDSPGMESAVVVGTTSSIVPAGPHQVRVAADCLGNGSAGFSGVWIYTPFTAIVLP